MLCKGGVVMKIQFANTHFFSKTGKLYFEI